MNSNHTTELQQLIESAIGGDVLNDCDGGFINIMSKKGKSVQQDIAVAFEMYSLLSYFLKKIPLLIQPLTDIEVDLSPSILLDTENKKIVALLPVNEGELDLLAHWVASGIRSNTVRGMSGILALPFSIEIHNEVKHLIPEWFAAYYVNGDKDHCIPCMTMRSVTMDERFGDWVTIALERMPVFGLPCSKASAATRQKPAH